MATGFQVKTHECCTSEAVRRLKMAFSWRSDLAVCRRSFSQRCRVYFFGFFRANSRATISFLMASKVTLSAFFQLPPD